VLLKYFAYLSNNEAGYLIYVAKSGAETGINSFGLLFYNSLLAIPFVFVVTAITGEFHGVAQYEDFYDFQFQVILFFSNFL
jgi:hypothetical protein